MRHTSGAQVELGVATDLVADACLFPETEESHLLFNLDTICQSREHEMDTKIHMVWPSKFWPGLTQSLFMAS